MELTLIPIAALLVLWTGLGTPAHLAAEQPCSVALMRLLLGREPRTMEVAAPSAAPRTRQPEQPRHSHRERAAGQRAELAASRLSRSLRRTRFGLAGGAYRSQAPPRLA